MFIFTNYTEDILLDFHHNQKHLLRINAHNVHNLRQDKNAGNSPLISPIFALFNGKYAWYTTNNHHNH